MIGPSPRLTGRGDGPFRRRRDRSLLAARPGDVAGIGHLVGYDSPSQFNREYRRLFGAPPGQDTARLRADTSPHHVQHLP